MATITGGLGNDTLIATAGGDVLFGDPFPFGTTLAAGHGGNDILTTTNDGNRLIGDANQISGTGRGGNDSLIATGDTNALVGDALSSMSDSARGGNDRLTAVGDNNLLIGDAGFGGMSGSVRGGNDALSATGDSNFLTGDSELSLRDNARGGNDTLSASGDGNQLYGDVGGSALLMGSGMVGSAQGGNDVLTASGDDNILFGDAGRGGMSGSVRGGNDVLTVVSTSGQFNQLYGDALTMANNAVGGNDTLVGGMGDDLIVGDVLFMLDNAKGGNDHLWGDAKGPASGGADTFHFAGLNGRDVIYDFRPREGDLLDLLTYGFGVGGLDGGGTFDFADLDFTAAGGNTVIDLGTSFLGTAAGQNTITLRGFTGLDADDFATDII